jgi:hypothetical protein
MSPFIPLSEAARMFGFGSGPALRKSFERGLIPQRYLVRIGARILRVDVVGLEAWMRQQQAYPTLEQGEEANNGG